jgi:hypothetical protein
VLLLDLDLGMLVNKMISPKACSSMEKKEEIVVCDGYGIGEMGPE